MGWAATATPAEAQGGSPPVEPTGSIRQLGASHLAAGPEGGTLHDDEEVGNNSWRAKARR
jgi:hypothetical protein